MDIDDSSQDYIGGYLLLTYDGEYVEEAVWRYVNKNHSGEWYIINHTPPSWFRGLRQPGTVNLQRILGGNHEKEAS